MPRNAGWAVSGSQGVRVAGPCCSADLRPILKLAHNSAVANEDFVSVFSSENRANLPVYPLDVFVLTDLGTAQLQGGATQLPREALEVMVLMDGKATVGDLEQQAPNIPPEALRNIVRSLISGGLARAPTIAETDGLDFSAFFEAAGSGEETMVSVKASATREAETGAPQLQRTGYYVSIARKAVKALSPRGGAKWAALVIEDDPDVSALVRRLLEDAGFTVRVAANRDQTVAALRDPPLPDVVILDVMLPDVNGFDILKRMKVHPALKAIPVIMLTAEAKRESVVKCLGGGADGYITKPFEKQVLLDGVRAILGIEA
jgi:two-component system OmpR family response regulator